jgi:DNA-binding CsgD family transcriptional regulator
VASTLVGLISPEAESLYDRLRVTRSMRVAEFDANGAAATELATRGLITHSPDGGTVRPVELARALRILLTDEQRRLATSRERVLVGWDRLLTVLSGEAEARMPNAMAGIQLIAGVDEVARQAAALYDEPRRHLRAAEVGGSGLRLPSVRRIHRAGVRYRLLCQQERRRPQQPSKTEQIRLCDRVALTMVHVDDTVALVVPARAADSALLVRSAAVLSVLADWFDLLWDSPASVAYPPAAALELSDDARRVLALMASENDAAIARRMRVSVSTVRRTVRTIYEVLGVNNRFAAGMVAAKRGWI